MYLSTGEWLMISIEELRPELLVWWTRVSGGGYDGGEWDCPAVITRVNENHFWARSLDDFKEAGPLRLYDVEGRDPSARREMRICTVEEVEVYLKAQECEWEDVVTRTRRKLTKVEAALARYRTKASQILKNAEVSKNA